MVFIKVLTLNTHSLIEGNYLEKLDFFVKAVSKIEPDIISLQEVNQSVDAMEVSQDSLVRYYPCQSNVSIREDNHAYNVVKRLHKMGLYYHWTWLPIKVGYVKFTEGLATLSLKPILEVDTSTISNVDDYYDWRTRKVLGIRLDNQGWYYNTHMSWWNDVDEPFQLQWQRLNSHLKGKGKVWLMGDFNNPADLEDEGYSMVLHSNWFDTYTLAMEKDVGITVERLIDGWKGRLPKAKGMRIDFIFCNFETMVKSSEVIFNGNNEDIVSDHYGVIISTV